VGSVDLAKFAQISIQLVAQLASVGLSVPRGQSPVKRRQVLATVSCSGGCLTESYAQVTIGRGRAMNIQSNIYRLSSRGKKTIALRFSSGQLGKLRSGLTAGARIVATVYGAILDAGGNIEKRTAGQRMTITG
jgi:hypothetical protein